MTKVFPFSADAKWETVAIPAPTEDAEVLRRDPARVVAPDDVGRRANRDPHLGGPSLGEVGGDLRA